MGYIFNFFKHVAVHIVVILIFYVLMIVILNYWLINFGLLDGSEFVIVIMPVRILILLVVIVTFSACLLCFYGHLFFLVFFSSLLFYASMFVMLLVLLKYGVPFADYDILVFDNACLCHKGSIHSFFNLKSALCADNEKLTNYFLRLSELKKQLRMMQHKKKI